MQNKIEKPDCTVKMVDGTFYVVPWAQLFETFDDESTGETKIRLRFARANWIMVKPFAHTNLIWLNSHKIMSVEVGSDI